jgi:hypothetical protein
MCAEIAFSSMMESLDMPAHNRYLIQPLLENSEALLAGVRHKLPLQ